MTKNREEVGVGQGLPRTVIFPTQSLSELSTSNERS